jgi:hypothetical protein
MPNKHFFLLGLCFCMFGLLSLSGCHSVKSQLTSPPANQQAEKRMKKFDPFPDTRIGPRVAGLRPPGYRKPMSEPARSRQQTKPSHSESDGKNLSQ